MSVKLLTGHRLEFVSLKGGCTGSSESTLINMPHYSGSIYDILTDFKNATVTSLYISQNTVVCKIPLL